MQRLSISSVLIPSLLALMLISGCSRDGSQPAASGSVVHFGVGTADVQTKTSYGDLTSGSTVINWSSGDSIRIYSQQAVHASVSSQHWADYVVVSSTPGTTADIENAGGGNGLVWGSGTHQFYGIYPATSANDSISINNSTITAGIPKTQKYTVKNDSTFTPNMKYAFMFAGVEVSQPQNTVNLKFQPMFTAFELEVGTTAERTTLTKFTMTSPSKALSGRYVGTVTASTTTGESTIGYTNLPTSNSTSNGVEVNFGTGVTIQKGHHIKFTVFVIPHTFEITTSGGLTLEFTTSDDTKTMTLKTTTGTKTFAANKKFNLKAIELPSFNLTITASALADYKPLYLNGSFSVSSSTQVTFSRGNLFYDGSALKFEDDQLSTTPSSDGSYSPSHVSHFRWQKNSGNVSNDIAEAVSASTSISYTPAVTDNFFTNDTQTTPRSDLSIEGETGKWRALSSSEWSYLLNNRTGTQAPDIGAVTDCRYALIKVNSLCGMLIFPDIFTWPDGISTPKPQTFNAVEGNWNSVDYTLSEFSLLESAGCVFLLAAGDRKGSDVTFGQSSTPILGGYYSSSPYETSASMYLNNAYELYFSHAYVFPTSWDYRYKGHSVRLVRSAQ